MHSFAYGIDLVRAFEAARSHGGARPEAEGSSRSVRHEHSHNLWAFKNGIDTIVSGAFLMASKCHCSRSRDFPNLTVCSCMYPDLYHKMVQSGEATRSCRTFPRPTMYMLCYLSGTSQNLIRERHTVLSLLHYITEKIHIDSFSARLSVTKPLRR